MATKRVRDLQKGDVVAHPNAKTAPLCWTIESVQFIGVLAIIDFADGTSTAPTPSNAEVPVR